MCFEGVESGTQLYIVTGLLGPVIYTEWNPLDNCTGRQVTVTLALYTIYILQLYSVHFNQSPLSVAASLH